MDCTFYNVACECDLQEVHNLRTNRCRTAREQLNPPTYDGLNLHHRTQSIKSVNLDYPYHRSSSAQER